MSQFLKFLGESRGCADFRDPTAVFRINTVYGDRDSAKKNQKRQDKVRSKSREKSWSMEIYK